MDVVENCEKASYFIRYENTMLKNCLSKGSYTKRINNSEENSLGIFIFHICLMF